MVSQTEPYNRADDAVDTVTLGGDLGGEWTLTDAVQLARAILAAVDWTAEAAAEAAGAVPAAGVALAVDAAAGQLPRQDRHAIEAQIRAVVCPDGTHHYLSTYCVDGNHPDCRLSCMQCKSQCLCSCHSRPDGPLANDDTAVRR